MDVNPGNPQIARVMDAVFRKERGPVAQLIGALRRVMDRLFSLPVPIIAALNGSAHGGGAEMAVRCDLRVMDPAAVVRFSEVRLGLMPDWGGGVALTRLVGAGQAGDLILTARAVTAPEALQLGLVNRVSAPGAALAEAMAVAGSIAANGPRAVRSALAVIRRTHDLPLDQALSFEAEQAVSLIAAGECLHGIGAFLSKKPPEFPDGPEG
jgi:enoyl-CoA hydratase/carnithine racemase